MTALEPAGNDQPLCAGAAIDKWWSFGARAKSACFGEAPPKKGSPEASMALERLKTTSSSLARFSFSSREPAPALMNPANAGKTSFPGAELASSTVPTDG